MCVSVQGAKDVYQFISVLRCVVIVYYSTLLYMTACLLFAVLGSVTGT